MHLFDYIIDLIVFPSDVYHMWIPRLDIVLKKERQETEEETDTFLECEQNSSKLYPN